MTARSEPPLEPFPQAADAARKVTTAAKRDRDFAGLVTEVARVKWMVRAVLAIQVILFVKLFAR